MWNWSRALTAAFVLALLALAGVPAAAQVSTASVEVTGLGLLGSLGSWC